jgi:flagellar basal body-associated protein FliL
LCRTQRIIIIVVAVVVVSVSRQFAVFFLGLQVLQTRVSIYILRIEADKVVAQWVKEREQKQEKRKGGETTPEQDVVS